MNVRLAIAFGLGMSGCAEAPAAFDPPDLEVPDQVEIIDVSATREEFLAELAPLPWSAVAIDYDVQGPGGISGTLSIWMTEGARRKETWSLTMPMPDAEPARIEGAAIQTPDWSWTDAVEGSAVQRAVNLGRLADAYLELETSQQIEVTEQVRRWHAELRRGRKAHPGRVAAVLGQECLQTQSAGQSLCVWEATGLPLEFRSEAFTLVARAIDTEFALPEAAFSIPAGAQRAADAEASFDAAKSLQKLAEGDLAEVAVLLQPGLRLPGST